MSIERIEEVVYGVADIDECRRFWMDAGLASVEGQGSVCLTTQENQRVTLRDLNDPALPAAIEPGSTLRQLIWGVTDAGDLDRLERELGPKARRDGDHVWVADPNGLALGFRVMDRVPAPETERHWNQNRRVDRLNTRLDAWGATPPIRIVHCALNITKAANEAALAFYTGPLRFRATDKVLDTGTFLQCEGDAEHHNFFLCFRPDQAGINHIALEVWDMDAVIEAGNRMVKAGWKESRRLGRHRLGSNVFRFVHAPCGGRIEFVADMDRMDQTWETRVFEKNPGHHLWSLKSSGAEEEEAGA